MPAKETTHIAEFASNILFEAGCFTTEFIDESERVLLNYLNNTNYYGSGSRWYKPRFPIDGQLVELVEGIVQINSQCKQLNIDDENVSQYD